MKKIGGFEDMEILDQLLKSSVCISFWIMLGIIYRGIICL